MAEGRFYSIAAEAFSPREFSVVRGTVPQGKAPCTSDILLKIREVAPDGGNYFQHASIEEN